MCVIRPVALSCTHMEARSLAESVPFLTDLLAFQVEREEPGAVTLKHPNSECG